MNCQTCNDPTKYIFALWDGPNGTHGRMYNCNNNECRIKRENNIVAEYQEEHKKLVIETNEANMIFVDLIKAKRKELQITIFKMAKSLGISPSDYSNYEMCRVALPVEMGERIEGVFRGEQKDIFSLLEGMNELKVGK